MIESLLANHWTTAQDLFSRQKIHSINASVRKNIQKILEEVGLGDYRPTKVPFIS